MKNSVMVSIQEIMKKFPNKRVFCDEGREMLYCELEQEAKSIASRLISYNFQRSPIIILMNKRVECLSSFVGVIFSGNYYTPIDSTMPPERVRKIINVLKPELVITEQAYANQVTECVGDIRTVYYEDLVDTEVDEEAIQIRQNEIVDTDLLYVLFTSGSTGIPKGVTISHRAVIDFAEAVIGRFCITEKEIFANQGPFYFDLSVLDIYCTLFTGATMYITPPEYFKFPVRLLQYIQDRQVNAIFWVPSALVIVANLRPLKAIDVSCLKKIMFCGEVMPNKQLNIWRQYLPNALYVNMYGPTETTCASTYYVVDRKFKDSESLPIGIPFINTKILLLNDRNQIAEPGETGEICIKGSSLSSGYYGDEEKTREVFIQNPLQKHYQELIYRTGDLATYNERGELIYICRKDFQIKHMGHRIELGEIEAAIGSLEKAEESCCVYDESKNRIIAFVSGHKLSVDYCKEELLKLLPDYMLPNKFYLLEHLPHNLNGKIDRVKLKNSI